ncbi:hypothetical protein BHM03_00036323 [Ensete ventricosum]|nr:hypothetical protein BHM03_00036323 [Ensete ventricosum]
MAKPLQGRSTVARAPIEAVGCGQVPCRGDDVKIQGSTSYAQRKWKTNLRFPKQVILLLCGDWYAKDKKKKGLPAPSPFFPTYLLPAKHSHHRYPLPRPPLLPASAASAVSPSSPAPATGQRRLSRSLLPPTAAVLPHTSRRHLCCRLAPPQPLPSSFPPFLPQQPLTLYAVFLFSVIYCRHLCSSPFFPAASSLLSPPPSAAYSPTPPTHTHASATQSLPPLHNHNRTHPVFVSPTTIALAGLSLPSSILLCQPQSSQPLLPCFSPSSLLLTCRRCHPSWAAAWHSSPLPLLPRCLLCFATAAKSIFFPVDAQ